MKILYIITKSEIGGAQTHVLQLMQGMQARGHTVALLCFPDGWLTVEAKKLGVTVYPNLYFKNSYNPFLAIRAMNVIAKCIHQFQPDIVSLHSSSASFLARMVIRKSIPTIYTAHGFAFTDKAPILRKYIAMVAEKLVAPFASKIICVSKFDLSLAQRYHIVPHKKLVTIYNGITIDALSEKIAHNNIKIVYVGRLAYPKETELLTRSFAALTPQIQSRATLHIMGNGPQLASLRNLVTTEHLEDKIQFLTDANPADVKQYLRTSDIFILLSKHEGFPMTILEAMEAGLPIIASAVGGIPEEINETSGILVENSIASVSSALRRLIQDTALREAMGTASRNRAVEQFSLERFLKETEQVYTDAMIAEARA